MTARELAFLKTFLRIVGTSALLAVFAVVMPYEWMNTTHQWLGMGELPAAPIVGYLARSTSAFYAMLGGLLWIFSFDLQRYRRLIIWLGVAMITFGLTLFVVDWVEGMPLFWIIFEGPIDTIFGGTLLYFGRRLER